MELKQKYKVIAHFHCSNKTPDRKADEFNDKLEDLMNEYEVIQVDAVLDPFDKEIKMV